VAAKATLVRTIPNKAIPDKAILDKAIPVRASPGKAILVKAILVKVVLDREILAKENQKTKVAAKTAAKVAKAVVPAVARVIKAAARVVNFDQCPLWRAGITLRISARYGSLILKQPACGVSALLTQEPMSRRRMTNDR
jgi:hypothetical protein